LFCCCGGYKQFALLPREGNSNFKLYNALPEHQKQYLNEKDGIVALAAFGEFCALVEPHFRSDNNDNKPLTSNFPAVQILHEVNVTFPLWDEKGNVITGQRKSEWEGSHITKFLSNVAEQLEAVHSSDFNKSYDANSMPIQVRAALLNTLCPHNERGTLRYILRAKMDFDKKTEQPRNYISMADFFHNLTELWTVEYSVRQDYFSVQRSWPSDLGMQPYSIESQPQPNSYRSALLLQTRPHTAAPPTKRARASPSLLARTRPQEKDASAGVTHWGDCTTQSVTSSTGSATKGWQSSKRRQQKQLQQPRQPSKATPPATAMVATTVVPAAPQAIMAPPPPAEEAAAKEPVAGRTTKEEEEEVAVNLTPPIAKGKLRRANKKRKRAHESKLISGLDSIDELIAEHTANDANTATDSPHTGHDIDSVLLNVTFPGEPELTAKALLDSDSIGHDANVVSAQLAQKLLASNQAALVNRSTTICDFNNKCESYNQHIAFSLMYQSERNDKWRTVALTATISRHPTPADIIIGRDVIINNKFCKHASSHFRSVSQAYAERLSHRPIVFPPSKRFRARQLRLPTEVLLARDNDPLAHEEQARKLHGSAAASSNAADSDFASQTARIEEPSSALEGGCTCATATSSGTNCACDSGSHKEPQTTRAQRSAPPMLWDSCRCALGPQCSPAASTPYCTLCTLVVSKAELLDGIEDDDDELSP
jgi:hypothetical protein